MADDVGRLSAMRNVEGIHAFDSGPWVVGFISFSRALTLTVGLKSDGYVR